MQSGRQGARHVVSAVSVLAVITVFSVPALGSYLGTQQVLNGDSRALWTWFSEHL